MSDANTIEEFWEEFDKLHTPYEAYGPNGWYGPCPKCGCVGRWGGGSHLDGKCSEHGICFPALYTERMRLKAERGNKDYVYDEKGDESLE